jgi:hypothetical protein
MNQINMKSRKTFYDWYHNNETFRELVRDAREAEKDWVETKLKMNIRQNKEASIFFFLKTQAKDRGYIERSEHDHSGQIQHNVFLDVLRAASEDEPYVPDENSDTT